MFFNHNIRHIGTFLRCFNLGKHLVQRGHKVAIVSPTPEISCTIKRKEVEGVTLVQLPHLRMVGEMGRGDYAGRLLRYVIHGLTCLRMDCDIVHAFAVAHASTALPAVISRFLKPIPLIVDWDDWWGRGGLARYHGPLIHSIMTLLEEEISLIADGVTVISSVLAKRAISIGVNPDKVFLLRSGVDVNFIKPLPQSYARSILGFNQSAKIIMYEGGAMTPPEHISLLVHTAAHLKEIVHSAIETRMVFVGVSPNSLSQKLVKELNLRKEVLFFKRQPYRMLPLFLSAADILVLPIGNVIEDRARWPGRMGDYLAAGQPIVASNVGDVGEIIRKGACGLLVQHNNPKEFAEKIYALLSDRNMRLELGRNAKKLAEEEFAWPKITKKLEEYYEHILSAK